MKSILLSLLVLNAFSYDYDSARDQVERDLEGSSLCQELQPDESIYLGYDSEYQSASDEAALAWDSVSALQEEAQQLRARKKSIEDRIARSRIYDSDYLRKLRSNLNFYSGQRQTPAVQETIRKLRAEIKREEAKGGNVGELRAQLIKVERMIESNAMAISQANANASDASMRADSARARLDRAFKEFAKKEVFYKQCLELEDYPVEIQSALRYYSDRRNCKDRTNYSQAEADAYEIVCKRRTR